MSRTILGGRRAFVRSLAISSIVATAAVAAAVSDEASAGSPNTITGTVFQDYNSNGEFDGLVEFGVAKDIGVGGIIVEAFDTKGRRVGPTTTAANGTFTLNLSGAEGVDFRVEFTVPEGIPSLSAFRSSFVGPDSGTSIQFVQRGATNVDYGINVPDEFCQNNPNIAVSRQCLGRSFTGGDPPVVISPQDVDISDAPTLWVTEYDGGPHREEVDLYRDDIYVDWSQTTAASHSQTKSIHGIAWDARSGRIFSSAYVRRSVALYEAPVGTPLPGALFATSPNGTQAGEVGAEEDATEFFVDLETLLDGRQFSGSNSAGPGYVPSNFARGVPNGVTDPSEDPADAEALDADIDPDFDGVYEEVGKVGIGEIDADGNGNLYVVSLFDGRAYRVVLPADGDAPEVGDMVSLGLIAGEDTDVESVECVNGDPRPFGVEIWRGSAYFGIVCDGSDDYDPAFPNADDDGRNLTFSIRRYDIASSTWELFVGPISLSADDPGELVKGSPVNDPGSTIPSWGETARWNPWTDTFSINWERGGWPPVRPVPMLSDIEFDRDGSIILGFRDRSTDQSMNGYLYPDGSPALPNGLNTGDIKRLCLVNGGYVFEGESGCDVHYSNTTAGTATDDEYYLDDFGDPGHADTSAGMTEYVAGFPEVMMTGIDPYDPAHGEFEEDVNKYLWSSGGVKWMLNDSGGIQSEVNPGGGVLYYTTNIGVNDLGSFNKANGMGDIEALCDQAPLQIGNRLWRDLDGDGIQDAGEPPIAGVTVRLYNELGQLVGTAITNDNGEYYFVSTLPDEYDDGDGDEVGGGLEPYSSYQIRLDNPEDYSTDGPLRGLVVTRSDAPDSSRGIGFGDRVDSDARNQSGYPTIFVGARNPGENDHDFDFGFVVKPRIVLPLPTPPIESDIPKVG